MVRLVSGNDFSVHLSKQTVQGAINVTPAFDEFRRSEGKARVNTTYVQSAEVKTNRQARSNVSDAVSYAAELSHEMTEQSFNLFQDAIQGTEVVTSVTDTDISSSATGFDDLAGDGFTGMAIGDYIFVSGFADATLNRTYRITTFATGSIDTSPAPSVIEAAGATVTIETRKTTSASTIPYYTVQTRAVDTSKAGSIDYQTFVDGQFDSSSFEVGESGIVTGAFNMVAESLVDGTAIVSGQTDNAKDTSEPLDAINGVVKFWVDGLDADPVCTVKSMGFEFSNNLQEDRAAGCTGAEYANGDITLSGSLSARLRIDDTMIWRDRYIAGTKIALALEIDHGAGKHTVIEVPQAVITEHEIPDGSNVVANSNMSYTAEEDPRGTTMIIYKDW